MKNDYALRHKLALLNPYKSIVKVLDADDNSYLVGIKNISSIPNTLMHKLEPYGFSLHTIDKKSQLAGRAVDTELINPITGHYMSGSSSGTAINVFAGINDLGIGNDGGGSVLAPAMCVNIYGFISKLIEKNRKEIIKSNTDGIYSGNSIGFFARDRKILFKAIEISTGISKANEIGTVFSDRDYDGLQSKIIKLMDSHAPRKDLCPFLSEILKKCDVLVLTEGPVDLEGFGDSLFGHFDSRTKKIQESANKGYLRVCNIVGATALSIPCSELGVSILLICESKSEKISKLLKVSDYIPHVVDPLIEKYFLDLHSYFNDGYQI